MPVRWKQKQKLLYVYHPLLLAEGYAVAYDVLYACQTIEPGWLWIAAHVLLMWTDDLNLNNFL